MKTSQGAQSSTGVQPSVQSTHEVQDNQQSALGPEAPGADSGSHKKVSHDDIELVQNLIERCLLLYMNKAEVVRTLSSRARIEPGFTTLVWQKLEEENPEFFRAYYIRLKLKRQIIFFNHLLEHQHHLLRYPAQVQLTTCLLDTQPFPKLQCQLQVSLLLILQFVGNPDIR